MRKDKDEQIVTKLQSLLIAQGILKAEEPISLALYTHGPEVDRICLRTGNGSYLWIEVVLPEGRYYPVEQSQNLLQVCSSIMGGTDLPVHVVLPTLVDQTYYVYTDLPSERLLFQLLMSFSQSLPSDKSQSQVWQLLPDLFYALGRYLGRFHAHIQPAQTLHKLPHTAPAIELTRSFLRINHYKEEMLSQSDMTLQALVFRHSRLMEALHSACANSLQISDHVLLHGSFSLGKIIVSRDLTRQMTAAILGGIDIWYGPSAYDPGLLLGELLLLYATSRHAGNRPEQDSMGKALLQGYFSVSSIHDKQSFIRDSYAYAMFRVVEVLLRNARFRGLMTDYVTKILDIIEEVLPHQLAYVLADEKTTE